MLSRQQSQFTLAAGTEKSISITADYVLLHEAPSPLEFALNGEEFTAAVQGSKHQSAPGQQGVRRLRFRNASGSAISVTVLFGLGLFDVIGPNSVSLTGTVPLPTGAATAALQTTGNTSLASIVTALASQATAALQTAGNAILANILTALGFQATAAKQDTGNTSLGSIDTKLTSQATAAKQDALLAAVATATKQDAQTALLTTLAGATTETPDVVTITGSQAFANCREISIENTGAANITATPAGGAARTITPGSIRTWRVSGPFNKLATITVDATGSSADVLTTV